MDKYTQNFKEEIVTAVTNSILQKLDGAVLQSFVVPNVTTPQPSEIIVGTNSAKPGEGTTTKRSKSYNTLVFVTFPAPIRGAA